MSSSTKLSETSSATSTTAAQFTKTPKPNLPLPPPILSLTPNTWAYDTMSRRINDEILQRTYDDNAEFFNGDENFKEAAGKFEALRNELKHAGDTKLVHLDDLPEELLGDNARVREWNEWHHILSPYIHDDDKDDDEDKKSVSDTWLSTPWLTAEFYVYRKLMQTFDYFNPASKTYLHDPFYPQKKAGLVTSISTAEPILQQLETLTGDSSSMNGKNNGKSVEDGMALASAFALWGNKMDLSIWPADDESAANVPGMFQEILASAADNLLHDDTPALVAYGQKLKDRGGGLVDIIVDNAGFELIMDLALADYLVASGVARVVRFQLKSHPTFVSDALEKDLREHVDYYASIDALDGDGDGDGDNNGSENDKFVSCKKAGERWNQYLTSGQWECHENAFWVQPPPMWEMPLDLRTDLKERCDLAFVKGDANYRRLLGDLQWDFSKDSFEDVVGCYFPCPVCALRTLKAEVGCGMEEGKVERAKELDADNWSTNGRFGVVHFSMGAADAASE